MMRNHFNRREALWAGALGSVGLSLPQLLRAESAVRPARPKSIILVVPWGGPAQVDSLDPKPHAGAEHRSPFRPIPTNVVGTRISEHLPRLAHLADRYAIIRSASHRISTHNSATHYTMTGHPPTIVNRELVPAQRSDWPCVGSVLARFQPSTPAVHASNAGNGPSLRVGVNGHHAERDEYFVPSYMQLPLPLIDNGAFTGGQNAGFLGTAFDPLVIARDPNRADFSVPGLSPTAELSEQRLAGRADLLRRLDAHASAWRDTAAVQNMAAHYEQAYDLMRSAVARQAFDIAHEPERMRERYGRTRFGQSVLMARRLVEAGVRLVMVSDTLENTNDKWDTHGGDVHPRIRTSLRESDQALAALMNDLRDRGLWDTTLVIWMAEFGRTPRVANGGGRDHWPQCYSLLLAGGGFAAARFMVPPTASPPFRAKIRFAPKTCTPPSTPS